MINFIIQHPHFLAYKVVDDNLARPKCASVRVSGVTLTHQVSAL